MEMWLEAARTISFTYWLLPIAATLYVTANILAIGRFVSSDVLALLYIGAVVCFLNGEFPPPPAVSFEITEAQRTLLLVPTIVFGAVGLVTHIVFVGLSMKRREN